MKSTLITSTVKRLKERDFYNIKTKYRESRNNRVFSPNVIAYNNKNMHMIDVKANIHKNQDYVRRKWKYLSNLAKSINTNFEVVVPKNQMLYARLFLLQNNLNPTITAA